ncbi:hypothetical protein M8C21_010184, partial [Ambrosia artemisiifolia]
MSYYKPNGPEVYTIQTMVVFIFTNHRTAVVCSVLYSSMATSSFRFTLSPLIHTQNTSKLLFSISNLKTKSLKILRFSSLTTPTETLAPPNRWEPYRKKKVVMRVGYVGTDYRGLQMQKDDSIS